MICIALTCRTLFSGYSRAEELCKEYRHTKGPGSTAKPSEQQFFLKLGGLIKNTLDKCQRENGFMWVRHTTFYWTWRWTGELTEIKQKHLYRPLVSTYINVSYITEKYLFPNWFLMSIKGHSLNASYLGYILLDISTKSQLSHLCWSWRPVMAWWSQLLLSCLPSASSAHHKYMLPSTWPRGPKMTRY